MLTVIGIIYTLRIYAQFWTVAIPLFGSNVILKSVVTQCESYSEDTLTPTSFMILLEMLCAYIYARGYSTYNLGLKIPF